MTSELNSQRIQYVSGGAALAALGLVHRVRVPAGDGPHPVLVMLHGLYGSEDVTWVFAHNASPAWLIISPRAPFPAQAPEGAASGDGFRWSDSNSEGYDDPHAFDGGLAALDRFVKHLPEVYAADLRRMVFLGFSQGAVIAYAYTVSRYPWQPLGIAALSGFIPPPVAEHLPKFNRLPVLILHGTQDNTVPIATARRNRDQLIAAGADVDYQESEVGHKVSAAGMVELRRWIAERLDKSG